MRVKDGDGAWFHGESPFFFLPIIYLWAYFILSSDIFKLHIAMSGFIVAVGIS